MAKRHLPPSQEMMEDQTWEEYRKENPISPEEKEKNRLDALKEFFPKAYEAQKAKEQESRALESDE